MGSSPNSASTRAPRTGPSPGWLQVDLSVRVLTKTGLDLCFQGGDLFVGRRDQGRQSADGRAVRGRDQRRLGEVFFA